MEDQKDTVTLTATLESAPFARDPPNAKEFYAAAGRLIMLWGRFETNLDGTLRVMMNLPESSTIRTQLPDFVPVPFRQKKKLWKKLFKSLERLEPYRDHALRLIADADDAAQDRTAVVHSSWEGFVGTDPLTVKAIHRQHRRGKILTRTYEISVLEMENVAKTVDGLNTRLLPILFHVVSLHPRPNVSSVSGDLGSPAA